MNILMILTSVIMIFTGTAHIEQASAYIVNPESVICEIGDGNLYEYMADHPSIERGENITLVMTDNGEIIAAW